MHDFLYDILNRAKILLIEIFKKKTLKNEKYTLQLILKIAIFKNYFCYKIYNFWALWTKTILILLDRHKYVEKSLLIIIHKSIFRQKIFVIWNKLIIYKISYKS